MANSARERMHLRDACAKPAAHVGLVCILCLSKLAEGRLSFESSPAWELNPWNPTPQLLPAGIRALPDWELRGPVPIENQFARMQQSDC